MDDKDPHIRSQDSAHRRGLVLGLTMAEIMVLILFTLLLALAAALALKDKRIRELVILEQQISDLVRNSPTDVTVSDIVQRLERQQNHIAALEAEIERLKTFEASANALEDIIREIRRTGEDNVTLSQIIEKIQQAQRLIKENDNLRGQVAQLTNQIRATGRGNEFPSCWVTPDGKAESIFELLIDTNGIEIRDRHLPHRTEERARLPLSSVHYDTELTLTEFQSRIRPLYQWSVQQGCRFYVIIFSSEVSARVDLVNAVNGFFYPDSRIQLRQRRK